MMRNAVLASLFTFCLTALAAVALFIGLRGPVVSEVTVPPDQGLRARADRLGTSRELQELHRRLADLEGRLDRSLDRLRDVPAEKPGTEVASKPAEQPADASLPDPDADGLREVVFQLIEEEREQRQAEARRQAEERRREREEMRKGPYGKFNYQVNSMAKRLELNDFQKQRYHEALVLHAEKTEAAAKNVDWQDGEARKQHQTRRREIAKELDDAVLAVLTPEQAETYKSLPDWQKRQGVGLNWSAATAGGGGAVQLQVTPREE